MGSGISTVTVMSPTKVLIWLQDSQCAYSSADRASVFGTEGRGFESLWARHLLRLTPTLCYATRPSPAGSANLLLIPCPKIASKPAAAASCNPGATWE